MSQWTFASRFCSKMTFLELNLDITLCKITVVSVLSMLMQNNINKLCQPFKPFNKSALLTVRFVTVKQPCGLLNE